MRSLIRLIATSAVVFLIMWAAVLSAAEPRTWTSAGGKFKIENASLVDVEKNDQGEFVAIIDKAGKQMKVPVNKLSQADQDYIHRERPGLLKPAAPAPDPELPENEAPRSWTSANGKFKIENATMQGVEKNDKGERIVVIKTKAEKLIRVPLDKLSALDRDFVNRFHPPEDALDLPDFNPPPVTPKLEPKPEPKPEPEPTPDPEPESEVGLPPATPTLTNMPLHASMMIPAESSKKWINLKSPLNPQTVGDKAVVLVCVDTTQGQTSTARAWARRLKAAKSFQDQPVIFVAVLPRLSPAHAKKYLAILAKGRVKLDWPFLVDSDGHFSSLIGAGGSRRWGIRGIDGNGKIVDDLPTDLSSATRNLLKTARWRSDPKGLPESLQKTWHKFEQGQFSEVAGAIRKGMNSKNAAHKRHATRMNEFVQEKISELIGRAVTATAQGNKAHAYRAFDVIMRDYKGYMIDDKVTRAYEKLAKDPQLKDDIAAFRALDRAMNFPKAKNRENGYNAIIKRYPETTAAKDAEFLLELRDLDPASFIRAREQQPQAAQ